MTPTSSSVSDQCLTLETALQDRIVARCRRSAHSGWLMSHWSRLLRGHGLLLRALSHQALLTPYYCGVDLRSIARLQCSRLALEPVCDGRRVERLAMCEQMGEQMVKRDVEGKRLRGTNSGLLDPPRRSAQYPILSNVSTCFLFA